MNLTASFIDEDEELYPSSDGQPMAETQVHVNLLLDLLAMLSYYFRKVSDVLVAGNIFLYYREGHPKARLSPDIMVVKGVDGRSLRRSFKTWVENAVPRVIFELTSRKTKREDQGKKKQIYEKLQVQEYFLFDPLRDYLPRQLLGYRLVNGKYKAIIPEVDGSLISDELGLRLVPEGKRLVLVDCLTGEQILYPQEAYASLEEANAAAQQMENELAQQRRKNEELAAELKRLKSKRK